MYAPWEAIINIIRMKPLRFFLKTEKDNTIKRKRPPKPSSKLIDPNE